MTPRSRPASDASGSEARAGLVLVATLAALAMLGPFTIDTIFPGFQQLGEQFDVGTAALQQVTSAYLVAFAVMSVVHGPLSDALGRRTVMIGGLAGYVVASIACALAPSFGWLLVGRAAQGVFAGAATVVSRAVIPDLFSGPTARRLMSQVMLIFAVAPAIAPVIGGWLLLLGRWPLIFWFVAGYAVLGILLVVLVLPETLPPEDRTPLRLGAVVGGLWTVARSWRFERLAVAGALTFGSYILYVLTAPILVVDLLGQGEQDFWKLFVPLIGGMALGSYTGGRLASRVSGERLVDVSMVAAVLIGLLNIALVWMSPSLPWAVVGPALFGVVIGLAFPVVQLTLLELFPRHRGSAASMAAFSVLLSNALIAGVVGPLITTSLVSTAATSAAFATGGALLWWWHRRDPVVQQDVAG
ncbi:multidrug effflux MFS transporter [Ornithinimicrobium sufpigmenti]|uniref:multidrug effflux MFS transporter n=1 Tax=Ornithinimicrobium sufpigmenti TaxID=2508882 RepID=UPI001EDFBE21|nr:multidrug effflux MFS transporter [Ornithinimicrobium sp. HY008]